MKIHSRKSPLTFATLIAEIYTLYGKKRAKGIIRLASKAHLIKLPDGQCVEFV